MTLYSVYERSDEIAPAMVPDKFSWAAAILPPVYALYHGLWLGALLYVTAVAVLGVASLWIGGEAVAWLYLLLAVLIGFEAPGWRRRKLEKRGWTYRGDVVAPAQDLAMRDWLVRRSVA
ncbi:MAG TPA: DUF2628 domain-containing protein [Devosia sp.]